MKKSHDRISGVSLDLSPMFKFQEALSPAVERAIKNTLTQARWTAKSLAHVDSGAMEAGTYTATHDQSDYDTAVAAAQAIDPKVVILPEVQQPGPGEGVLSNATEQSVFEEFGTVEHGPHPFMMPAAEEASGAFITNLEDEIRKITPR